jgi:hypothetical protein
VLIEPGNFRTRAGLICTFPNALPPARAKRPAIRSTQPWPAPPGTSFPLGDARQIARLAADIAESDDPRARYLIGKDAHHLVKLDSEEFEGMVRKNEGVSDPLHLLSNTARRKLITLRQALLSR